MVGCAGWRLRLIRPTGAICLRGGFAGWLLRLIRPTGEVCRGFGVMPDGGCALSGLRVRYAGGLGLCRMAATPYPAYGCGMPGFGFAGWRLRLSRLRVRYVGGFGFAGWRLRLIRPTGAICRGFWFCRMAATPYPAYGCGMPGVWFRRMALALIPPTGAICLLDGCAGWRLRLIRPTVTKLLKPRRPDKRLRAIRQWDRA